MTTNELRKNMFSIGRAVLRKYTMKGMTQAEADGKSHVLAVVEDWINSYQFETIKKVIGYLKNESKIIKNNQKDIEMEFESTKDKEYQKELTEEMTKWCMADKILNNILFEIGA